MPLNYNCNCTTATAHMIFDYKVYYVCWHASTHTLLTHFHFPHWLWRLSPMTEFDKHKTPHSLTNGLCFFLKRHKTTSQIHFHTGLTLETSALRTLCGGQFTLSIQFQCGQSQILVAIMLLSGDVKSNCISITFLFNFVAVFLQ